MMSDIGCVYKVKEYWAQDRTLRSPVMKLFEKWCNKLMSAFVKNDWLHDYEFFEGGTFVQE